MLKGVKTRRPGGFPGALYPGGLRCRGFPGGLRRRLGSVTTTLRVFVVVVVVVVLVLLFILLNNPINKRPTRTIIIIFLFPFCIY